jgi:hypothetical protein
MSIPAIVTNQIFSRNALGFLWSKRTELDPAQVKIIQSLYNNKSKGRIEGCHKVTYKLSCKQAGRLGYGRLYGDIGSLETLEREARGTLCREFYDDIDIVNAHPVILVQFAKRDYNTELSELKKYVLNRKAYLNHISDNYDEAKKAVICVLYNGKCNYSILQPLADEVKKFTKMLSKEDTLQSLWESLKNEDNHYGSFLSFIIQTEERHIMLAMRDHFESNSRSVDVLAYDGVMVRKSNNELNQSHLSMCEDEIFIKTNYKVTLLIKPFEYYQQNETGIEVSPKVLKSDFVEKKLLFEQNHFYLSNQNKIVEVSESGELNTMSIEHANIHLKSWDFRHSELSSDRTAFVPLWLNSNDIRKITKISMKPSDDPSIYTLPLQFAYMKTELPKETANVMMLFNTLVDLWANGDEGKRSYLISYFAHMIQKPFEIPGVALVASGKHGVGKDTLANFLMEHVVGMQYSAIYPQTKQLFGEYDSLSMNKIIVKLEEANGAILTLNMSAMKSFITSPLSLVNQKGLKEIQVDSFKRFILTSNEASPVKIEANDRRFVLFNCDPKYMKNNDFWDEIYKVLFTSEAGAIIGDYLSKIDISDFNVRVLPKDEYKNELIETDKSSIERFVDSWDGAETRLKSLFSQYKLFCMDNLLQDFGDTRTFSKSLNVFKRDNVIKSRKLDGYDLFKKTNPTPSVSMFVDEILEL